MRQKGKFRLDTVANEFLVATDIGKKNDLYLISFLDFYLFAWLSHFGIINYIAGNDCEPVIIELTEFGGRFVKTYARF